MNTKTFVATLLMALFGPLHHTATAQSDSNNEPFDFVGLSVFIDAGITVPNNHTAAFYNGRQGNHRIASWRL